MTQQSQFKSGAIVYDKDGNSAIYDRPGRNGHFVFPQMNLGWGDEEMTLDRTFWPEVFDEPPPCSFFKFWIVVAFVVGGFIWSGVWLLIQMLKSMPA